MAKLCIVWWSVGRSVWTFKPDIKKGGGNNFLGPDAYSAKHLGLKKLALLMKTG